MTPLLEMDSTTARDFAALPTGSSPSPVALPHFPDVLHAVVWRNWDVIQADALAAVLNCSVAQLTALARSMGLPPQRTITAEERRRNTMTVIRRNWHLLPYEQLCPLLGWDAARMK